MQKKYLFIENVYFFPLNTYVLFAQLPLLQTAFFAKNKVVFLLYKKLMRQMVKLPQSSWFTPHSTLNNNNA
jgi:hypothetical protein